MGNFFPTVEERDYPGGVHIEYCLCCCAKGFCCLRGRVDGVGWCVIGGSVKKDLMRASSKGVEIRRKHVERMLNQ